MAEGIHQVCAQLTNKWMDKEEWTSLDRLSQRDLVGNPRGKQIRSPNR